MPQQHDLQQLDGAAAVLLDFVHPRLDVPTAVIQGPRSPHQRQMFRYADPVPPYSFLR